MENNANFSTNIVPQKNNSETFSYEDFFDKNRVENRFPYAVYCSSTIERVNEEVNRIIKNFLVEEGAEVKIFNTNEEQLPIYAIWRGSEAPNTLLVRVSETNSPQGFIGIAGQIKRLEVPFNEVLYKDFAVVEIIALTNQVKLQQKYDTINNGLLTQRSCIDLSEVTGEKKKKKSMILNAFYSLPSYKNSPEVSEERVFSLTNDSNHINVSDEESDERELLTWLVEKAGYVSRCIFIETHSKLPKSTSGCIEIYDPGQVLKKNWFSISFRDKLHYINGPFENNGRLISLIKELIKEKSQKTQFAHIVQIFKVSTKKSKNKEKTNTSSSKSLKEKKRRHKVVTLQEDLYSEVITLLHRSSLATKNNYSA